MHAVHARHERAVDHLSCAVLVGPMVATLASHARSEADGSGGVFVGETCCDSEKQPHNQEEDDSARRSSRHLVKRMGLVGGRATGTEIGGAGPLDVKEDKERSGFLSLLSMQSLVLGSGEEDTGGHV